MIHESKCYIIWVPEVLTNPWIQIWDPKYHKLIGLWFGAQVSSQRPIYEAPKPRFMMVLSAHTAEFGQIYTYLLSLPERRFTSPLSENPSPWSSHKTTRHILPVANPSVNIVLGLGFSETTDDSSVPSLHTVFWSFGFSLFDPKNCELGGSSPFSMFLLCFYKISRERITGKHFTLALSQVCPFFSFPLLFFPIFVLFFAKFVRSTLIMSVYRFMVFALVSLSHELGSISSIFAL